MTIAITVPIQGTAHDAAYFQPGELTATDMFTCAYTDGPHGYTVATIRSIQARGHGIWWNHERGQLDLAGGAPAGTLAANEAMPAVVAAGTPLDGTIAIVYSVDGSVAQADFTKYDPAFKAIRAAHEGRFLIGFYGELALYKHLKALGLVDVKCWLSASSSFPGYDPNDPDVGVIQTVGTDLASTDRDLVTDAAHLGVWYPPGSPYAPKPTPTEDQQMLIVRNPATGEDTLIGLPKPIEGLASNTVASLIQNGALHLADVDPSDYAKMLAAFDIATDNAGIEQLLSDIKAAISTPGPVNVTVPPITFPSFTVTPEPTP